MWLKTKGNYLCEEEAGGRWNGREGKAMGLTARTTQYHVCMNKSQRNPLSCTHTEKACQQ